MIFEEAVVDNVSRFREDKYSVCWMNLVGGKVINAAGRVRKRSPMTVAAAGLNKASRAQQPT